MKNRVSFAVTIVTLIFSIGISSALDLDFGQNIIQVPDTHDSAPYLWQVRKDPSHYRAEITSVPDQHAYLLTVSPSLAQGKTRIDLFLTDKYLKSFSHPTLQPQEDGGQAGYEVQIKQFPEKVYAKHTAAFVFEIRKNGEIVEDLESIDGAKIKVAAWRKGSWFSSAGDFVYADSQGNESNLEAAVSLVFNESGKHRIFAEYRHQGVTRGISKEIDYVLLEPAPISN